MNSDEDLVNAAVHESRDYRGRALLVAIGALSIALLITAGVAFYFGYTDTRNQAEAGTSLAEQVKAACDNPNKDAADLGNLCNNADSVIDSGKSVGIKGDKGDPGVPGEPGPEPSAAQVANAVAVYCAGARCRGSDGANASPRQVAAAVGLYCNARGKCAGPDGSAGVDGSDGATGPQGAPPTGDQIAAAVAAYCDNRGNCRGPVGPKGDTGQDGPPGDTVDGCTFDGVGTINIYVNGDPNPVTCTAPATP